MSAAMKYFGADANPLRLGPIITGITAIGFLGTCPVWYKAGREYEKIMKKREEEKEKELDPNTA